MCLVLAAACASTTATQRVDPPEAKRLAEQVEAHFAARRFADAAVLAEAVLRLRRQALGSHILVAESLTTLGTLQRRLGRLDEAEASNREAIAMARREGGALHPELADALDNLAVVLTDRGRYAEAETLYLQAKAIGDAGSSRAPTSQGSTLNNLAELYRRTGRPELAETLFKECLAIYERVASPNDWRTAATLSNLGGLYLELERYSDAEPLFLRSMAIAPTDGNVSGLGAVRFHQGRLDEAVALHKRSLAGRERIYGPDHPLVAHALTNLASVLLRQGDTEAATQLLMRAVATLDPGKEPYIEWRTYAFMARATAQRSLEEAAFWGKEAVSVVQAMKAEVGQVGAVAQAQFMRDKELAYTELAQRLLALGRVTEAQLVMQMLKEHELQELTRASGPGDPRTTQSALSGPEQNFSQVVGLARQQRLQSIRNQPSGSSTSNATATTRESADAAFRQRVNEAAAQLSRTHGVEAQSEARPGLRVSGHPRLTALIVENARADTQSRPMGVQYISGEKTLSIVLTAADGSSRVQEVEVPAVTLHALSLRSRELARSPRSDRASLLATLQQLHTWLIAPIEEHIESQGARTLVIASNGALRYVPFSALHDGRRYLAQRFPVVMFVDGASVNTSAATDTLALAAFGLTKSVDGLPALPGVALELVELASLPGMATRTLLDEDFNVSTLKRSLKDGLNNAPSGGPGLC
jgi:CHAT domain-containing protein/Tfp pilus assembly protein PilF